MVAEEVMDKQPVTLGTMANAFCWLNEKDMTVLYTFIQTQKNSKQWAIRISHWRIYMPLSPRSISSRHGQLVSLLAFGRNHCPK